MSSGGVAERMKPERKRTLVRVAAREFARAGYAQASLNRVVRDCGMSKSSFYHFVPSKQELFALVVDELGGELLAALELPAPNELAGPRFWPGVAELAGRLAKASASDDSYLALGRMFYLTEMPADASGAVARALAAVDDWIEELVTVGRSSGQVRDDLPASLQSRLALAVLRTLDEWTLSQGEALGDGHDLGRLLDAQLAALQRLLGAELA